MVSSAEHPDLSARSTSCTQKCWCGPCPPDVSSSICVCLSSLLWLTEPIQIFMINFLSSVSMIHVKNNEEVLVLSFFCNQKTNCFFFKLTDMYYVSMIQKRMAAIKYHSIIITLKIISYEFQILFTIYSFPASKNRFT